MPAVKPGGGGPNAPQQQPQQRTTFRPPWVKEGPEPLPLPTAPWTLARARQKAPETEDPATIKANLKPVLRKVSCPGYPGDPSASTSTVREPPARKTSMITIIPSRPSTDGNAPKENGYDVSSNASNAKTAPPSKPPVEKTKPPQPQSRQIPIEIKSTTKPSSNKPEEKKIEVKVESKPAKRPEDKKEESKIQRKQEEKKVEPKPSQPPAPMKKEEPKVQRKQEEKSESKPPQPPAPPMPPPPMPGMQPSKPLPPQKAAKIEALKSRPRKRPDWGALMKDIEHGQKGLKHVQCNDRSTPLIPRVKVKDKFMYESEKPNVHNQLLKEIQGGIKLKRVQTNDRSKPLLEGLRKFRRQLTIEEQIQKAAAEDEEAATEDELDDIDKVRDDLQSTKQMLALELRNKEALERENKKLQTRILNLEVEIEKERAKNANAAQQSPEAWRKDEEQERKRLRTELDNAQKSVEDLENKYHDTVGQLDMTRSDLEEANRKNQALERKLQIALANQNGELPLTKQPSAKRLAPGGPSGTIRDQRSPQGQRPQQDESETEESEYEYETESSEEDEEEEDQEALQERRNAREIKLLTTKLASFKDKELNARKERKSLRDQIKKEQKVLKEEKKKYRALQKEVDKMAKLMKDDEDEEEEEEEDEEEEESEESESESESEESEEEESDGDLPPDAPVDKRKQNLTERSKRHENCLAALRKGNYLLKATLDRLKDELFKQKEMAVSMQEDLNSVLAELG